MYRSSVQFEYQQVYNQSYDGPFRIDYQNQGTRLVMHNVKLINDISNNNLAIYARMESINLSRPAQKFDVLHNPFQ